MTKLKVSIFHNILWSKYKGVVFSEYDLLSKDYELKFFQIAETERDRVGLSGVDLSYHTYPYRLIYSGAYENIGSFRKCLDLFLIVLKSDADLVVLPGYHLVEYWAMLLASKIRIKKVGVFCDSTALDRPNNFFKSLLKRFVFRQFDLFLSYGSRSSEYLESYGVASEKIFIRCQAAALPHNYDSNVISNARVRNSDSIKRGKFIYVGRLSKEKNIEFLLEAFKRLNSIQPAASLLIIGSGPHQLELKELTLRLGLSDVVSFAGAMKLDDLQQEYLSATALVLPSKSEPWGLVVNEALAFGCPVLVSNNCGCVPELVIDGITGYVFNIEHLDELFKSMLKIIEKSVDVIGLSNNCVNHISGFSPRAAAEQIDFAIRKNLAC